MAARNYDECLKRVLAHEGGWSNHPNDPGGATMRGVIQRVYDGYRDRKGVGRRSVRHIEEPELQDIYSSQYWRPIRGDDLPAGIDLAVFDAAVNSGPVQAALWLQRALGVTADGHIGEGTLDACLQDGDHAAVIGRVCDQRLAFMRTIRNRRTGKLLWPDFGKGWSRRVADIRAVAAAMAETSFVDPDRILSIDAEAPYPGPDPAAGKAVRQPTEKTIRQSRTLWAGGGIFATLATAIWQAVVNNPSVVLLVCLTVIAALTLFICRERVKRFVEEAL